MCVNSRCRGFAVSQYPERTTPSEGNVSGNNIKALLWCTTDQLDYIVYGYTYIHAHTVYSFCCMHW